MGKETTHLDHEVSETTYLENEIRRERAELAGSIQALEDKASRASNWRYQFAKRPGIGVGVAFLGGLLLARLVTNGKDDLPSYDEGDSKFDHDSTKTEAARVHARETRKTGLMNGLQAALVSVITHEAKDYLRNRFRNA